MGEHSGHVAGVRDAEAVPPPLRAHQLWVLAVPIVCQRPNNVAIVTNDFKHCGLSRTDRTPKPQAFVRVIFAVKHQAPSYQVVQQRLHVISNLELGTDRLADLHKLNLLRFRHVS